MGSPLQRMVVVKQLPHARIITEALEALEMRTSRDYTSPCRTHISVSTTTARSQTNERAHAGGWGAPRRTGGWGGGAVPGERLGGGAVHGERVGGDGAVSGLKARANPDRSRAVEGKGCGRHTAPALHGMHRVGLAPATSGQGAILHALDLTHRRERIMHGALFTSRTRRHSRMPTSRAVSPVSR